MAIIILRHTQFFIMTTHHQSYFQNIFLFLFSFFSVRSAVFLTWTAVFGSRAVESNLNNQYLYLRPVFSHHQTDQVSLLLKYIRINVVLSLIVTVLSDWLLYILLVLSFGLLNSYPALWPYQTTYISAGMLI